MSNKFLLSRDISGAVDYGLAPCTNPNYSVSAAITTPSQVINITVPYGAQIARFASDPGASIWVNFSGTAVIPTSSTPINDLTELNPSLRDITGVTTISVSSAAVCSFKIVFSEGPNVWGNL